MSHSLVRYLHRRSVMRLTMIFIIVAFGCGHVSTGKDPSGDDTSSGLDAGDSAGYGGSECQGRLDDVGGECPGTFDGTPENVPACGQGQVGVQQLWSCGE